MNAPSIAGPRPQISITSVLDQVWQTLQENPAHFLLLTLVAGTVPAFFMLVGVLVVPSSIEQGRTSNVAGFVLFSFLSIVAYSIAYLMLAVACHRCVLLAEQKMAFGEWSARVMPYAWRALIVGLVTLVPAMILYGFAGSLFLPLLPKPDLAQPISPILVLSTLLLGLIVYVPASYFACRLSLVLPAITIDRKLPFDEAWSMSEGNGWRLVVLTALIPFGIPMALDGAVGLAIGEAARSVPSVAWTWGFFDIYFQTACIAVGVVILSTCFRQLSRWPDGASK